MFLFNKKRTRKKSKSWCDGWDKGYDLGFKVCETLKKIEKEKENK